MNRGPWRPWGEPREPGERGEGAWEEGGATGAGMTAGARVSTSI